jgi:spermidine/putrescine transport system ATP-binding protein
MAGGRVQLVDLVKHFDDVVAVDDVSLEIGAGEFFSLLGPSGCGKTTTLRLVAGFERPTSGRIDIDGVDMASTPPHLRPVNTVFQNYALFPHLSVAENVAFGLRYQKVDRTTAERKVAAALELVQMDGLEERRPSQLSGGQQQRVALARALVLEPQVLLLDEPLGALDAKLRKALQIELKSLQEQVGITFIYVTHDQEEALTMSDRLAVMRMGRVEQVGSPSQVYERPATIYVADFLGVSNLMSVMVEGRENGGARVRIADRVLFASGGGGLVELGQATVSIRPERIALVDMAGGGDNRLPGTVERIVYAGSVVQVLVDLGPAGLVQAVVPNHGAGVDFHPGDRVGVHLPADALLVLEDQISNRDNDSAADSLPPSRRE